MANKLYEETCIQAIANAIREKTGDSTMTMKVSEMADYILSLDVVPPVYGYAIADVSELQLSSNQTVQLGIKLDTQPTKNQTVSITASSDAITLSQSTLSFTPATYNVYQYVTLTSGIINADDVQYISFLNSDPSQTESSLPVYMIGLKYSDVVDTTIPTEGMHTVTASDFASTSNYSGYIRLYGYNAEYENIKVPSTINGKIPWIVCGASSPSTSNSGFAKNTTLKYVTFEDGVIYRAAGTTSGVSAQALFSGCTSLIGVSNMNTSTTSLSSAFNGCTSLKFVDNLEDLVDLTSANQAFLDCTALEYVQDLSTLKKVGLQRTFRGCTNLKKVFGLPQPASSKTFEYAFMDTKVTEVDLPVNISSLEYCFYNCSTIKTIRIHEDALTTSNLGNFTNTSQQISIYANSGSTTLASLNSKYASSSNVTVYTMDGGSALPFIVVWGDSTSSPNRSWIEWPKRLQRKLGTSEYLVKNEAVSGEWTTSTSGRQGGNAIHTNAFTIPADTTSVLVTLTSQDGQTFSNAPVFSRGGSYLPCTIDGVSGTITKSDTNYYFKRSKAGEAVNVESGTLVISNNDDKFNNEDNIMLIQLGHNSGWNGNANTLLNQIQLMVDHFEAKGGTKYIITGPWSGNWIYKSSQWAVTQQFNTLAATAFGSHYFNLPQDIADNCQTDNPDWTPTAEDLTLIAEGKTPRSLTSDNTHPNEYGAQSMMMAYYRHGVTLGYWD